MSSDVKVPILLMAFIRPDLLKKCLSHLEKFKPPVLYVMGDGPRNEQEIKLCQESRSIALNPGWDCDIIPIFNDENEGIVKSFLKGMGRMFSEHEYGIYLEDDIMLSSSFYRFAKELLIKYKDEENIGHINATNVGPDFPNPDLLSYYFGNYTTEWGFATWKRLWDTYDVNMSKWKECDQVGILKKTTFNYRSRKSLRSMFDLHCYNPDPHAWGYQWHFNCLLSNKLAITPTCNMSLNMGFEREDSTNTFGKNPIASKLKDCEFPLRHPNKIERNIKFDRHVENILSPSHTRILISKLKKFFLSSSNV